MRPILVGLAVFIPSGVLWWFFNQYAMAEAYFGKPGTYTALMYVFGALFFLSLPVTLLLEFLQSRRRRG